MSAQRQEFDTIKANASQALKPEIWQGLEPVIDLLRNCGSSIVGEETGGTRRYTLGFTIGSKATTLELLLRDEVNGSGVKDSVAFDSQASGLSYRCGFDSEGQLVSTELEDGINPFGGVTKLLTAEGPVIVFNPTDRILVEPCWCAEPPKLPLEAFLSIGDSLQEMSKII